MHWNPGVRARHLTISITLVLLAVGACVGYMLWREVQLQLTAKRRAIRSYSDQVAQLAQNAILENPREPPALAIAREAAMGTLVSTTAGDLREFAYCAMIDTNGSVLAEADPHGLRKQTDRLIPFEELENLRWSKVLLEVWRTDYIFQLNTPVNLSGQPFVTIAAGVPAAQLRAEFSPNVWTAVIFGGVMAGLGLLGAGISSGMVLRPWREVVASIELLEKEANAATTAAAVAANAAAPANQPATPPTQSNANNPADMQNIAQRLRELGRRFAGSRNEIETIRDQLQQVVGNVTERVLLLDREQRVIMASPEAEKLLSEAKQLTLPLPGQRLTDSLLRNHPLSLLTEQAFTTRKSLQETVTLPATPHKLATGSTSANTPTHGRKPALSAKDAKAESEDGMGTPPTVLASLQLFQDRGQPAGALLTLRDFATIQRLETQLDFASKVAALNRITAGVAHEVKNPLHSMVLHLELLTAKLEAELDPRPHLEILTSEVNRLKRVVQTFLDFTRPVDINLIQVDANTLLREVILLATDARAQGVQIIEQYGDGALPIKGDADLLKQALLNIIINGCQAMQESNHRPAQLTVQTGRTKREQHDFVFITISDTGTGIAPEVRDKIFNLYFTTKPKGSGIGLAQAFRAVQLHNGTIELETEPGQGTTFHILVPAV